MLFFIWIYTIWTNYKEVDDRRKKCVSQLLKSHMTDKENKLHTRLRRKPPYISEIINCNLPFNEFILKLLDIMHYIIR